MLRSRYRIRRIPGLSGRYNLLDGGPLIGAWNRGVIYLDGGADGAVVVNPLGIGRQVADTSRRTNHAQEIVSLRMEGVNVGPVVDDGVEQET